MTNVYLVNCSYLLLMLLIVASVGGTAWDYEHVAKWPEGYPICGETRQSPINIDPSSTVYNALLSSLKFKNYDIVVNGTVFDIINNGHTVQVTLRNVSQSIGIYDGALGANFTIEQFHFHWGSENTVGSEHTMSGVSYPEEIHLVHYNSDLYANVSDAANHTGGLAVLGIFMQISERNNTAFDAVIQNFKNIKYENFKSSNIVRIPINSLLPPNSSREYFRYEGSLTTPPCHQSVTWTVFRQPLKISALQLEDFRTALFKNESGSEPEHIVNNYRTVLPLNGRNVTRSIDKIDIPWSYETDNGPSDWKYLSPMCGWSSQSPVNIPTTDVTDADLGDFTFKGLSTVSAKFNVTNTGHAVELSVGSGASVSGGGLDGTYSLEKVVFHWGSTDNDGSEHTVNGKSYSLEIQFMYRSDRAGNRPDPSKKYEIAIISTFAKVGVENAAIGSITKALPDIKFTGTTKNIDSFDLTPLLPTRQSTFYRYDGSLTQPNCAQLVAWTIFTDIIEVSSAQVKSFRTVLASDGLELLKNVRPVQALNERTIHRSQPKAVSGADNLGAHSAALVGSLLLPAAAVVWYQFGLHC